MECVGTILVRMFDESSYKLLLFRKRMSSDTMRTYGI